MLGREVAQLVNEEKEAGYYSAVFDGTKHASGIYFVRLSAKGASGKTFVKTMKMVLMK